MFWALRKLELGPRLKKFKSPKCGYRELEICTNSELISRSPEIVTSFTTQYFAVVVVLLGVVVVVGAPVVIMVDVLRLIMVVVVVEW